MACIVWDQPCLTTTLMSLLPFVTLDYPQEHRVLHDVLLDPSGRCHGWRLVLAGHSLGAGCAFLLGLYLRQFCPNLK